jgi:Lar family restriction alleviation protein
MELKPCPFCGDKEPEVQTSGFYLDAVVYCLHCGAVGSYRRNNDEAIEAWNTRIKEDTRNEKAAKEE